MSVGSIRKRVGNISRRAAQPHIRAKSPGIERRALGEAQFQAAKQAALSGGSPYVGGGAYGGGGGWGEAQFRAAKQAVLSGGGSPYAPGIPLEGYVNLGPYRGSVGDYWGTWGAPGGEWLETWQHPGGEGEYPMGPGPAEELEGQIYPFAPYIDLGPYRGSVNLRYGDDWVPARLRGIWEESGFPLSMDELIGHWRNR